MSADQYLRSLLARERVDTGFHSPVRAVIGEVRSLITPWANRFLVDVSASGSFAKGTANHCSNDIDAFISLSSTTEEPLAEIYETLCNYLEGLGYQTRRQNVSIGINLGGYQVDLVPAKRQDQYGGDHALYKRKAQSWTKTNVNRHISLISQSQRTEEIRIIKLWRHQRLLDFPSFPLELFVLKAVHGQPIGALANNVWRIFNYLTSPDFLVDRVLDPSNTNNIVSETMTQQNRRDIAAVAQIALRSETWEQIVT